MLRNSVKQLASFSTRRSFSLSAVCVLALGIYLNYKPRSAIVPATSQKMKIVPVPVRSDNYAYLLIDEETKIAAAVDPFDVAKGL